MCLVYKLDHNDEFQKTLANDHRACRYNCERNGRCMFAIFSDQICFLYLWDYSVDEYGNTRPDRTILLPINKPNYELRVIFVRSHRHPYGEVVPRIPRFTADDLFVEDTGLCSVPGI